MTTPVDPDGSPHETSRSTQAPAYKRRAFVVLFLALVVVVGLFAARFVLNVRTWWLPTESMAPTLNKDSRVLTWDLGEVERGDIVVFTKPEGTQVVATALLHRVVAFEGETVSFENDRLHIDGSELDEPYLADDVSTTALESESVTVPSGHVFVLGDNRSRSSDSRVFGPIPLDSIMGNNTFKWR